MTRVFVAGCLAGVLGWPLTASTQEPAPAPPPEVHEHVVVDGAVLTPTRETSGTAWIPSATPMYGVHRPWRGWDVRVSGTVFVQALYEPGNRHRTGGFSTRQAGSLNWGMLMARRSFGGGRFGMRTMLSAEPWTVPGCGSLNFLATGEVCDGDTVHDRQQPHDLVMELAVDYERSLRGRWRWQVYAGLAGEPALGPPGYPHRASAVANPIGPVTHHWLDATHVTFGLVTLGVHNQRWKTSRCQPSRRSHASLRRRCITCYWVRLVSGPRRSPFGATHAREAVSGGILEATRAGGLLESSLTIADRHTIFGRGEFGRLPGHHLHTHEYARTLFPLGKVQMGYVLHLPGAKGLVPGLGAIVSLSVLPPDLAPRYGGRVAPGVAVFFNLRPARHAM